jgi:hypothetical protein
MAIATVFSKDAATVHGHSAIDAGEPTGKGRSTYGPPHAATAKAACEVPTTSKSSTTKVSSASASKSSTTHVSPAASSSASTRQRIGLERGAAYRDGGYNEHNFFQHDVLHCGCSRILVDLTFAAIDRATFCAIGSRLC